MLNITSTPLESQRTKPIQSNVARRFALVTSQQPRMKLRRLTAVASCGFPSPAADCEDERVTLDELLVRRPLSSFLVEAEGDSMVDAGICAGDILVIDRAAQPRNGSIVLASYNGEFLLRRLRYNERGYPELHAECYGSDEVDICPKPEEQFDIEGVAVGLTRKL